MKKSKVLHILVEKSFCQEMEEKYKAVYRRLIEEAGLPE